ncbi:MAG TPA: MASE3 domain-containing protein [Rhodocyclaceae bacterium]|nr:MASE3 domain-containing protein [Rhodocyclaceae bacterium]
MAAEFPVTTPAPATRLHAEVVVRWGSFALVLGAIAATSLYSYVLFHSLVEIFRIVVIFSIAALAWNARGQIDHPFLLAAGLAYPSIGHLELLHTLAYKGMGVFPADANLPTQFWIALRAYEALAMVFAASLASDRRLPAPWVALGFLTGGAALTWAVLTGYFPDCFIEGKGLTGFKIGAEYVIAGLFAVALVQLWRRRFEFGGDILRLVLFSMVCDILAEAAFTQYVSVYGPANLIGHLLLLTSTYGLYRAVLIQGIQKPQQLLFAHLSREKELLARSEAELAIKVAERTAELKESNLRLAEELEERNRIGQRLAESEEMLRLTRNVALDAMVVIDDGGRVVIWNPAATRMFGYEADEAIGSGMHDLIVPERFRRGIAEGLATFAQTGTGPIVGKTLEMMARRRDGGEFPVELAVSAVQIRSRWHAVGIIRDITDRKAAVQAQEQLAAIVESSQEAIVGESLDGVVITWNAGAEHLYGYTAAEMVGRSVKAFVPADRQHELAILIARAGRGEMVESLETQRIGKDGRRIDVSLTLSPIRDPHGAVTGISAFAHDISRRKAAENAQLRLNRRLKLLSASNQTLLHAATPEDLLAHMTQAITQVGGFAGAWIGAADPDRPGYLRLMGASQPEVEAAFQAAGDCLLDPESPVAEALGTGDTLLIHDRSPLPPLPPVPAGIVLPLGARPGSTVCLVLWADDPALLVPEELATLEEMAADLNFGLAGLRIKTEREHSLRALARAMEDTIQAIAGTVEMRDPYTAGHQRRVAELSGAIARELGLPEDRIHAIALAATIHDLGKINIPAEILTRPGKLSDIEFSLIKTHPAMGYEIIKNIDFPWPIAAAMRQHHERLDGSGYPDGLTGDAITLEARIIGAADVVEAMSSHRPYRPGLGIDAALAELTRGRGIQFDPQVVDACLRLVRERGFKFSKPWGNGN